MKNAGRPSLLLRRRSLLLIALGLAGFAVANAAGRAWWPRRYGSWSMMARRLSGLVTAYSYRYLPLTRAVERYFAYLRLAPGTAERFAKDYENAVTTYGLHESMDQVFARFIASTDFFQNGGDESRTVSYVLLHHPYASPCYNPFVVPEER